MELARYMEAVYDSEVQLSYHALIGKHKYSVFDAEQLFGSIVLNFFENKQYLTVAEYVRVIRNWHRACDERGQRIQYHDDFLSYILKGLMPWYEVPDTRDLSLLDV